MNRTNLIIKLLIILLLAGVSGFVAFDQLELVKINKTFPFRLGLDLIGGTHLIYEGELKDISAGDRREAMSSVREVIERRVNLFGVTEPVVQLAGESRLIVELPGVRDVADAVKQIGQTPFLDFREERADHALSDNPTTEEIIEHYQQTQLSGKHLQKSDIVFDPNTNKPQISLQFDDEGKKIFAQVTERNIGKQVAIFLDDLPISAPMVTEKITAGQAVITGNFTIEESKELAGRLNAGALPVPIKLLSQQNIGPSLGQASLRQSILAGIIGFFAIGMFMIIYYRIHGLFAILALLIYIFLSLTVFKLLNVTLTLAGIAGFILSVGMAVDANILIFERIKEEFRAGKPVEKSLEEGFRRAWNAIRDSNISSLITVFFLAYFGSSLIRGFAITLGIGILVSMFTAIIVSRTFLRIFYSLNNHA